MTKSKGVGRGRHNPNKQLVDQTTESFRNYIVKFRNSPHTKRAYADWIRRYLKYCNLPQVREKIGFEVGTNTDLLLFEGYNNGENRIRKIETLLKNYFDYLYDEKLSPKTVHIYYESVRHFYQSNGVPINWSNVKDYAVGPSSTNIKSNLDKPYTYEEIHRMLDKSDERKSLLIYLLCSTGMRRGAIPELKLCDLKYIKQYQVYEIKVYAGETELINDKAGKIIGETNRKSTNDEYTTYCSMECASAINSYLDFRKRNGEPLEYKEQLEGENENGNKGLIGRWTPDDSYLVRKQFNRQISLPDVDGNVTISLPNDPPAKQKVTYGAIQTMLYHLVYDAGIRDYNQKKTRLGDRHDTMLEHGFRKFFENKCLEAGIDPLYVEVLMGHDVGITKHYYRPGAIQGEFSLLQLYVKKAMPKLTISDEERLRLNNRELELRMQEDEQRFKRALAEQESKYSKTLDILNEKFKKLGID